MRVLPAAVLVLISTASIIYITDAKKPIHPRSAASAGTSGRRTSGPRRSSSHPPVSRRRAFEDDVEIDDEDPDIGIPLSDEEEREDIDEEEDQEEEEEPPRSLPSKNRRTGPPQRKSSVPRGSTSRTVSIPKKRSSTSRSRYEDEEEDEYEEEIPRPRPVSKKGPQRGPPPRSQGIRRGPPGRVVPYQRGGPTESSFTRGLAALRNSIPDPSAVREAAISSLNAARQTTSNLSANLYREVKGLTSSELEQVMLKATKPDDTPVKGKHVERLVGVTYQISSRYDIYDAVLRKLWSKMAEKDWRTTIKALYILHRFSADGAPEHAPALKARLRELRRTRDPKRKDKFFNSKQLLAGDTSPETIKFRAFMSRYAHYVLLRAQCFGGMFDEISQLPKVDKKKPAKPITMTSLREEHLEAAAMLLKAGVACQLKEGEVCENTAIAVERVASDLIGLTSAVAIALNRALKEDALKGADAALLKKWCEFYKDELLPQTRAMVKKTSPKLDAYGLFLPSRMGTSVSQEILDRGLSLEAGTNAASSASEEVDEEVVETKESPISETVISNPEVETLKLKAEAEPEEEEKAMDEEVGFDEEYEYEEDEYYDDEEL